MKSCISQQLALLLTHFEECFYLNGLLIVTNDSDRRKILKLFIVALFTYIQRRKMTINNNSARVRLFHRDSTFDLNFFQHELYSFETLYYLAGNNEHEESAHSNQ